MRKTLALALSTGLILGTIGSAGAAPKPVTVWEDPAGDADASQGLGQSIPGGFDLVSGTIARNGDDLEFTATMADVPPSGNLPEGFRFMWAFTVGEVSYRITAKTADIGKPDALAQNGTERVGRVDAMGHFRLEHDCKAGETIGILQPINCQVLEYITGTFDAATGSVTAVVPLALIKAKPGSKIGPGAGDSIAICPICWAGHTAERSHQDTIIDQAAQLVTYKVPK